MVLSVVVSTTCFFLGCAPEPNAHPTASLSSSLVPSSSASISASASWETFTTVDGAASWEMPAEWSVLPPLVDPQGRVDYEILDQSGQTRLIYSHKIWGLGGPGCMPSEMQAFPYTLLAEEPTELPADPATGVPARVVFETIEQSSEVGASLAVTNAAPVTGTVTCYLSTMVSTGRAAGHLRFEAVAPTTTPGGTADTLTFPSLADARAFEHTTDYATLTRILASLRVS